MPHIIILPMYLATIYSICTEHQGSETSLCCSLMSMYTLYIIVKPDSNERQQRNIKHERHEMRSSIILRNKIMLFVSFTTFTIC